MGRGQRGGGNRVRTPPRVLAIGGTDPCGGAGLAADVRTAAALGCHAMIAVTALTIQDSRSVREVAPVAPRRVRAQIAAALGDAGADCVKIGMLASAAVARAVADVLDAYQALPVVLDPVLRATTGRALLDGPGRSVLLRRLLPRAILVTPNLPEAEAILDRRIRRAVLMRVAAADLLARGARAVLLKGGHLAGDPVDVFADGRRTLVLRRRRIPGVDPHGSGCVLASSIACFIARGASLADAVRLGRRFVAAAIRASYPLGAGAGPVNPLAAGRLFALAGSPCGR